MTQQWDAALAPVSDALVAVVLVLAAALAARRLLLVVLHLLARGSGAVGRAAAVAVRSLRPGVGRRVVAATLGLGTPVVATVAALPPAAAVSAARLPADRAPADSLPTGGVPSLHLPTDHRSAGRPAVATGVEAARGAEASSGVVVVRAGDTLWDIARRHLPRSASAADVARAWPRWYTANRSAIGPDPDLLRPGTRLRSPDRRPAGTPASSHDRPPATRTSLGAVARSLDPDRR